MENRRIYIDPSITRKAAFTKKKLRLFKGFPVFTIVELNIYGSCTRNCGFCPISDPELYTKKNEGISLELYTKVLTDLEKINYDGKILYSGYSEPLLHKQIIKLISTSKKILPNCHVEIVSNGDLIKNNYQKLFSLFESGLDTINISIYDGREQMLHFKEMIEKFGFTDEQIVLKRRYYENGNYGLTISNRGGLIDSNAYRDENELRIEEFPLDRTCFYPFYQMLVDYNGDVGFCPHDWGKKFIVGNLEKENIWDIWVNRKF